MGSGQEKAVEIPGGEFVETQYDSTLADFA
jgi:hypothetical protein